MGRGQEVCESSSSTVRFKDGDPNPSRTPVRSTPGGSPAHHVFPNPSHVGHSLPLRRCYEDGVEVGLVDSEQSAVQSASHPSFLQIRPQRREELCQGVLVSHQPTPTFEDSFSRSAGLERDVYIDEEHGSRIHSTFNSSGEYVLSFETGVEGRERDDNDSTFPERRSNSSTPLFEVRGLSPRRSEAAAGHESRLNYGTSKAPPRILVSCLGNVEVQAWGFEDNSQPAAVLARILEVCDIHQLTKPQELTIQVVVQPGGSSSAPAIMLRSSFGIIKCLRPREKCTAPLAAISPHRLDLPCVVRELSDSGEDSVLLDLINKYLLATTPVTVVHNCEQTTVSRHFSNDDIKVLHDADLLLECSTGVSMPCFKVKKKDDTARFIMDCRGLNDELDSKVGMEADSLEWVISQAIKYPVVISTDANAYFFQFPLTPAASSRFPLRLASLRGSFKSYYLKALPMGFSYAPAIAQRTSNMIIRRTRRWIQQNQIQGEAVAWIDNFLVFAKDTQSAEAIMTEMQRWLCYFKIECKEVDRSGEFLGMQRISSGLSLSDKNRAKAVEAYNSFLRA